MDQAFLTGSNPRVWGAGEALSCHEFITFSDISMFSPFNFKKHQHIRKEVCPEIAVWMKVTFVGQQQKLEELMCLPLTASSHGHPPKQCTHLERGGGGHIFWLEKYSSVDRLSMRQEKKEEGRKDRQAGKNISLCARSTVPFNVQNPYHYPHLRDEKTSSEMGCVVLPRTQS